VAATWSAATGRLRSTGSDGMICDARRQNQPAPSLTTRHRQSREFFPSTGRARPRRAGRRPRRGRMGTRPNLRERGVRNNNDGK
jgi:hypothetical protein